MTTADAWRTDLCRELVADLRRLDAALQRNADDIAAEVTPAGRTLVCPAFSGVR
jgi:hypothetical protein